ncbi:MAG: LPS translocon maturation chaperone LptM [Woeseiaceae bacterium]
MKNHFRIPAALLLAMFILGCGQSGPLYVSGNPSTIQPSADQTDAEEDDESEGASEGAATDSE